MKQGVLKAEGVCKSYGSKQVLHNLDLAVEPGKIYGLIGRNGAGKTTLLGILTGQNTMNAGTVTYDGQPVWENRAALQNICFSRELTATMVAGLKVKYFLEAASIFYPGWDRAYAQRLLELFKLEPKKKIQQLSKGQSSMLTILIALASRSPLTILDEPAAGLDVVVREQFYRLLVEDFTQTGRTFIVSSHIIEEAASVFERVIILDEGRIVENEETEALVGQFWFVSGHAEQVEQACGGMQVLQTQMVGRHAVHSVRATAEQLAKARRFDVDIAPMNLQKVFVALCGHEELG